MRWLPATLLLFLVSTAGQAACPTIVSQSPYITKSLQWLGLESCIVGVSRYDELTRPHTGGVIDPDATSIVLLQPDLLFTSNWTDTRTLANVTPEGTRGFRLRGFGSMQEIEENLRVIGKASGIDDIEARIEHFRHEWLSAAGTVHGNGKRVLLLSSCSGAPYSFGKERWLSQLFLHAGFVNVETEAKIRHIRPGETFTTINTLVNELQPDILFIFEQTRHRQCGFIAPKIPLKIVNLDGEHFLHPAPVVLQGLAELKQHRSAWEE